MVQSFSPQVPCCLSFKVVVPLFLEASFELPRTALQRPSHLGRSTSSQPQFHLKGENDASPLVPLLLKNNKEPWKKKGGFNTSSDTFHKHKALKHHGSKRRCRRKDHQSRLWSLSQPSSHPQGPFADSFNERLNLVPHSKSSPCPLVQFHSQRRSSMPSSQHPRPRGNRPFMFKWNCSASISQIYLSA